MSTLFTTRVIWGCFLNEFSTPSCRSMANYRPLCCPGCLLGHPGDICLILTAYITPPRVAQVLSPSHSPSTKKMCKNSCTASAPDKPLASANSSNSCKSLFCFPIYVNQYRPIDSCFAATIHTTISITTVLISYYSPPITPNIIPQSCLNSAEKPQNRALEADLSR